jgi:hypothetical protein
VLDKKGLELELGPLQTQTAQKPLLREEAFARALRASKKCEESWDMGGRAMR